MSDDGTGAGIRIPAIMIGSKDGDLLKSFFKYSSPDEKAETSINVQFMSPH